MMNSNFVFVNLLSDRIRPHELREVLNRWGLALRTSKENQTVFKDHIEKCMNEILPSEKIAYLNLLDDLDEHIDFWDATPLRKTKKKPREEKPSTGPKPQRGATRFGIKIRDLEFEYLLWTFHKNEGSVHNTAEALGLAVRTVRSLIRDRFKTTSITAVRKPILDFSAIESSWNSQSPSSSSYGLQ